MDPKLQRFIEQQKRIQNMVTARSTSVSPIEAFRERKFRLGSFDIETKPFKQLEPGQAGYAEGVWDSVNQRSLGSGTSLIPRTNIMQFSMGSGLAGGRYRSLTDVVVSTDHLGRAFTAADMRSGDFLHHKDLISAVAGDKLQPGMRRMPFQAAQSHIQDVFDKMGSGRNASRRLLLGYNVTNADINWLTQSGIDTSKNKIFDVYRLAQVLMPTGYTGGMKQESVARYLFGADYIQSHLASGDSELTFKIFNEMLSPERWKGYSAGQQKQAWDILAPHFAEDMGAPQSTSRSLTRNFLYNTNDPYLLRQFKFDKSSHLFSVPGDGGSVARKIIHSGTKRGRNKIYQHIKKIDPESALEFKRLYKKVQKHGRGRIEFALERREGLNFFYMMGLDGNKNVVAQTSMPMHQLGTPSAVTYRGSLMGTYGQGLVTVNKGQARRMQFMGHFMRSMRKGLYDSARGGLDVSFAQGIQSGNIAPPIFQAMVSNAERRRVLYSGDINIDLGKKRAGLEKAAGVVSTDTTGRGVRRGALVTALYDLKMAGDMNFGLLGALDRHFRLTKTGSKMLPGMQEMFEEFQYINVKRGSEVATTESKKLRAYNPFESLSKHGQIIHESMKGIDASFVGTKPEDLPRGVFTVNGGIHMGLNDRAYTKGTFQFRQIRPFLSAEDTARVSGFKNPLLVPRGTATGLQKAGKLLAKAGQTGNRTLLGAATRMAVIQGSGAEGAAAAFKIFGDPGVIPTRKALPFLAKPGSTSVVHVQDLSGDLLEGLTPGQMHSLRQKSANVLGNIKVGSEGILGMSPDGNQVRLQPGTELRGVKWDSASQTFKMQIRQAGARLANETPLLINSTRVTAHGYQGALGSSHFIGHSHFFKESDLLAGHYMSKVQDAGLGEDFVAHMRAKVGDDLMGEIVRSNGQVLMGAPQKTTQEITDITKAFLQERGVSNIDPKEIALSAQDALKFGGKSYKEYGVAAFHRFAPDIDMGQKAGSALRLRMSAFKDAALLESALGVNRPRLSRFLKKLHASSTHHSHREFSVGMEFLFGLNQDPRAALSAAKQAGMSVLTPNQIRKQYKATGIQGARTVDSLKGTWFEKNLRRGFILDMGKDANVLMPTGVGNISGRKESLAGFRRYIYMPSAHLAGFGATQGLASLSKGQPFGHFAEAMNLMIQGDVDDAQIARSLFVAHSKWHRKLFGKDKLIDRRAMRTPKLTQSSALRILPHSQKMRDVVDPSRVYTAEVDIRWLRENQKQLKISDEFVTSIMEGRGYGYLNIEPHQRLEHNALVRLKAAPVNRGMAAAADRAGLRGPEASRGIRLSEELLHLLERDVDKDVARMLWLDTGKGSSLMQKMGIGADAAQEIQAGIHSLFSAQVDKMAPSLSGEFKSFLEREAFLNKNSPANKAISMGNKLSTFLAGKHMAPLPWVRMRHDRFMINELFMAGQKDTGNRMAATAAIGDLIKREFGLKVGSNNHLLSEGIEKIAKSLPDAEATIMTESVIQRYMQFALEKGGTFGSKVQKSLDDLAGLQVQAFEMANSGQDAKTIISHTRGRAQSIIEAFLSSAYSEKAKLKLGGFADMTGRNQESISRTIQKSARIAGVQLGNVAALRGIAGQTAGSTVSDMKYVLGRSTASVNLFTNRFQEDEVAEAMMGSKTVAQYLPSIGRDVASMAKEGRVASLEQVVPNVVSGGDTAFMSELKKLGYKGALDAASEGAGKARHISERGQAVENIIEGLTKDLGDLWKKSPYVRGGIMALGGLAIAAQARDVIQGTEDEYLNAPPIDSAPGIRAALPGSPMVGQPGGAVQYPIPQNPVSFQQRAAIGRSSPAVQMGGRISSGSPYSAAGMSMSTMNDMGIDSGTVSIVDARRHSNISAELAAKDRVYSDY